MNDKRYEKSVKEYKISTITPVHIGNGNKLSKVDFVLDKDKGIRWIIDVEKVISLLQDNPKALNEFGQAGFDMKDFLDRYKIPYLEVEKYSYECTHSYLKDISEFVKTGLGKPYIPGSSIKGALRTVILRHLLYDWGKPDEIKNRLEQILNNPNVKPEQADNLLDKYLFGKDPNYDFLRGLQVGDAEFKIKDLRVDNAKTLTISRDNRLQPKPFDNYIEYLSEAKTVCRIRIENFLFDYPLAKKQLGFDNKKEYLVQLAKRCNEYAREFIKDEIEFYRSCRMNELRKSYEQLAGKIPEGKNDFLLHLGWGSGWRGMTGDYLTDATLRRFRWKFRMGKSIGDYRTGRQFPVFPKTRKIIFKNGQPAYPLGWVKIEVS